VEMKIFLLIMPEGGVASKVRAKQRVGFNMV
jgi:hypothetical protein